MTLKKSSKPENLTSSLDDTYYAILFTQINP